VPPFTLSGVCSFDVLINTLADKEYGTTFVDQAGNPRVTLITGTDKVSLTNLSNGKSIGLNISGPGRIMPDLVQPSTWITEGRWLWFITPGASLIYSPRMFFISGRMVVQFDSAGQITNLQIIGGTTQDMCAALADL
jgi:hypothetical protein